ncbi:hypothetical protein [Bacillus salipaludis]|uniref:Uncharacterized protein n=1 Tax=Bacillus salipaludis TaxID=2547811 RepID=A0AA90TWI1_9BACI|nr:hypothetical protein [Bacillus salipaludis]MDQ6600786.1 hypothetical protein [Bacillus salipaludis]
MLELIGLILILLHIEPLIASAFIGIGAGGLFPINLLLPIDATNNAHDATNSFSSAIFGLIAMILLMIIIQFAATRKNFQTTEYGQKNEFMID